jgi:hypothetical protein
MDKYPITDAEANEHDSRVWAHESYEFSKDVVYVNDKEGQALSAEYIKLATPIAEKRIVIAGHRLASLLTSFKLATEEPAFLQ